MIDELKKAIFMHCNEVMKLAYLKRAAPWFKDDASRCACLATSMTLFQGQGRAIVTSQWWSEGERCMRSTLPASMSG